MLPAICDGDCERTQKKPAVNNSRPWSRQAGEGEDAPAALGAGGRERKFRTPQRTDIRKTSVRCTLGCCEMYG